MMLTTETTQNQAYGVNHATIMFIVLCSVRTVYSFLQTIVCRLLLSKLQMDMDISRCQGVDVQPILKQVLVCDNITLHLGVVNDHI